MKLALSNAMLPSLDPDALIEKARAWGYDGLELCGVHGEQKFLTTSSDLSPLRRSLADAGVTLLSVHTGLSFGHSPRRALEDRKRLVLELIERAAEVGCRCVVVSGARIQKTVTKAMATTQTSETLGELALEAAKKRITLAIENAGVFAGSRELWYLCDAGGTAALRVCWNPLTSAIVRESPTLAVPRLAASLAFVRLTDAVLGPHGEIERYVAIGRGAVATPKLIQLLRGIAYSGWLCVHWPRDPQTDAASADELFSSSAAYLRAELDKPVVELSAYKGDKNAPRFVTQAPDGASASP